MNTTTEEKLDRLAEYHAQKVTVEFEKRDLLASVQIPDDVQAIVNAGIAAINAVDAGFSNEQRIFEGQIEEELDEIVIPVEVKTILAEIDRKRALVQAKRLAHDDYIRRAINVRKLELQKELDAKVKTTIKEIANKRREIEEEFAGKRDDVDKNIADLEAEIKADVKAEGKSVKGNFFQAVFNRGRVTWNTDMLDGFLAAHPELKDARKEGEPSVSIRSL